MIPIAESVRARRTPWITGLLVASCLLMFLYELSLSEQALDRLVQSWGADPGRILAALTGDPRVPMSEMVTLFTSQFLHGGWLHLLGNMVFLWVFGRAVEDRAGQRRYLALYLMGGAGAGIFQSWVSGPESNQVLIGASGAIATVLGAYLVLFPTAWVTVLVPVFFFFWTFDVPAVLMLALWFFGQFFTGIAFITEAAAPGNVAVWAHVAGFVLGVLAGFLLPRKVGYGHMELPATRHAGGPGPAGLVSSVANLACLMLGLRVLLNLLLVQPGPHLLGQIAGVVYGVTDPLVRPLGELVPWLIVQGFRLDLPALLMILLIYLASGMLVRVIAGAPNRGSGWRRH